ncbi:MAG TPA: hypothetical protein VIG74_04855, partial [Alphaproteobacteria bacterium]
AAPAIVANAEHRPRIITDMAAINAVTSQIFLEPEGRNTAPALAAAARAYIADGNYDWNSGIFLLSAAALMARLKELDLALYENSYKSVARASRLQNSVYLEKSAFTACPHISIDRAVMEKSDNLAVIPVDMGWRDLGTWPELIRHVLTRQALRAA